MSWRLENRTTSEAKKQTRRAWADRVLREFEPFPERRLVIILDKGDNSEIRRWAGNDNRGQFWAFNERERVEMSTTFDLEMATLVNWQVTPTLDAVIYLHDSSCDEELGFTMTLAHELQHFIQHHEQTDIWAFNTLAANLSRNTLKSLGLIAASIPIEHEARIVAKRITEKLLGVSETTAYIERMENRQLTALDAQDWAFIKILDSKRVIHLAFQTKALFNLNYAQNQPAGRWSRPVAALVIE